MSAKQLSFLTTGGLLLIFTLFKTVRADESRCIEYGLRENPILFTDGVLINESSGTVVAQAVQLRGGRYLLSLNGGSVAFKKSEHGSSFDLTRLGSDTPYLVCFKTADERDSVLTALSWDRQTREKEAAKLLDKARAEEDQKAQEIALYIRALFQEAWIVPGSASSNMSASVSITLFPSGEIDQAYIERSSGNIEFDRSTLQAVYSVESFDRIADLDPIFFERRLRRIVINFKPEAL